MVSLLLKLTKPSGRLWVIGQPAKVAISDTGHLLLRVLLLTAGIECS